MEIRMVCGTWISTYDRRVIDYLKLCDTMPSIEEICLATELPESRVKRTLVMLQDQRDMVEQRERKAERDRLRFSKEKYKPRKTKRRFDITWFFRKKGKR